MLAERTFPRLNGPPQRGRRRRKLSLEATQAAKGGTLDPAKIAKCESKLSSTCAKNEARGGCNTTW
jgi:hypothetical protein